MGRDDSALSWSGILSGADAGDRARTFDAMRVAGGVLPLAWDAFCYNVVITQLDLDYCNPWWITYKVECTVLSDLAQSAPVQTPDVVSSILADLSAASGPLGLSSLLAEASAAGALLPGAGGVAAVSLGLSQVQASIAPAVASAEQALSATDIPTLVTACGSLAQLSTAQGYVGRALANLSGIQV